MFGWFKRKPKSPTFREVPVGVVDCTSPKVWLSDPSTVQLGVAVDGVPNGRHPVIATVICYPQGGERVARVSIPLASGTPTERRAIGEVGIDSATMVVLDDVTLQTCWREEGTERRGRTGPPGDHWRMANLIGRQFGLRWRQVDNWHSEFDEPISVELEAEITAFLQTIPEFAKFPFMYFTVKTRNSWDRVCEVMENRSWGEVPLDETGEASVVAVSTGFGDGTYTVAGTYSGDRLLAIGVEFIGPAQEDTLAAFPVLRH